MLVNPSYPCILCDSIVIWVVACGQNETKAIEAITAITRRHVRRILGQLMHLDLLRSDGARYQSGRRVFYSPVHWERWTQHLVPRAALVMERHRQRTGLALKSFAEMEVSNSQRTQGLL